MRPFHEFLHFQKTCAAILLEDDFDTQLHSTCASGPKDRVCGCHVWRAAGQAKVTSRRAASHTRCRLRKHRMIEHVEELAAKLCREFFVDLLPLAHGCVQVPVARTIKQPPCHCSEDTNRGGCYRGATLCPATVRGECG